MSCKQCRPTPDAAFNGVWSRFTLFALACLAEYLEQIIHYIPERMNGEKYKCEGRNKLRMFLLSFSNKLQLQIMSYYWSQSLHCCFKVELEFFNVWRPVIQMSWLGAYWSSPLASGRSLVRIPLASRKRSYIQCNFDPLKPHFYIVKLGFAGV